MFCWSCGSAVEKIAFRKDCSACNAYLHCCLGCKYFQEGLSNDCRIPGTERIADRKANNFCEEFAPTAVLSKKEKLVNKRFEDLFK